MIILLFLFILAPITILIHELGHAFGAFMMRADKIELNIGAGSKLFSIKVRKWTINVFLLYFLGAHTGSERDPYFSKHEQIVISSSGPILNGLVGFIILQWNQTNFSTAMELFSLFNFWLFFINLIPFKIGEKQSDGYTIFKALQQK